MRTFTAFTQPDPDDYQEMDNGSSEQVPQYDGPPGPNVPEKYVPTEQSSVNSIPTPLSALPSMGPRHPALKTQQEPLRSEDGYYSIGSSFLRY